MKKNISWAGILLFIVQPFNLHVPTDKKTSAEATNAAILADIQSIYATARQDNMMTGEVATLENQHGAVYEIPIYVADTTDYVLTHTKNQQSITLVVSTADATRGSGNTYLQGWDQTGSFIAFITLYYNTSVDNNGYTTYLLTAVSGGYTKYDTSVTVSSQTVLYGCNSLHVGNQTAYRYPGAATGWSYVTGFTQYVNNIYGTMGCHNTLSIKRGSASTWSFNFSNWMFS